MLAVTIWVIFWKAYGGVVILLLLLIFKNVIGKSEQSQETRKLTETGPNPQKGDTSVRLEKRQEINVIIPVHLKIWEPEVPPQVIVSKEIAELEKEPKTEMLSEAAAKLTAVQKKSKIDRVGVSSRENRKKKVKKSKIFARRKQTEHKQILIRQKIEASQEAKRLRSTIGNAVREMAILLNQVGEMAITERELCRAMRLMLRQQDLPHKAALQQLLWADGINLSENDLER
jgi:hypothetical protein